jgi:hypothetical protein
VRSPSRIHDVSAPLQVYRPITHVMPVMRVVGKQAVSGFARGDRQWSRSDNRDVLPVCHGERERRLPRVSGGPYGIDKSALAWPLPCASLSPLKGSDSWRLCSMICSSTRTRHDLAIAREPSWGAIRRRAARSLGESGRSFALGNSTSRTFWTPPDRLEAYFTPRRSLVRSQYRPQM